MITVKKNGFTLSHNNHVFLQHTTESPAFFIGDKALSISMDKGEFTIDDQTAYQPATFLNIEENTIVFKEFSLTVIDRQGYIDIKCNDVTEPLSFRLLATPDEQIFGLGEHFTSFNHRTHKVKNWVEEHITRKQIYNKIIRRLLKLPPKKWPFEEYKTYFIVPTFQSSNHYFCHVNSNGYGTFDFTHKEYHEISFVSPISNIVLSKQSTALQTTKIVTTFTGITPKLPDWVHNGLILGVQGGTNTVSELTQKLLDNNVKISGIWAQDWCGELFTYFGKQVVWNWQVDSTLYPNLEETIQLWDKQNIAFLAYINPYLNKNESIFKEAETKGYLVQNPDKTTFLTQATSFQFGIIDLTNPSAYAWFKELIKKNYIELGIKGWMADFGEYLPTSCILYDGNAEEYHNLWPDLWTKLNREVLEETNTLGDILFFNRAGYKDNMKYTTLIWNGDQHVDFTNDFGLKSVVRAMLQLSLSGVGLSHSDIGGYTTVPGIKRSKELYQRWLEMNTFSPIMRSHEGNRPWSNIQPYTDEKTIESTALFTMIHVLLKPYIVWVENQYQTESIPFIRPYHFYEDLVRDDVYFLGDDLYVCPVLRKRVKKMNITIPQGEWIHLFTGTHYFKGTYVIPTPLGVPAVFYRASSSFHSLFSSITTTINDTQKDNA